MALECHGLSDVATVTKGAGLCKGSIGLVLFHRPGSPASCVQL